MTKYSEEVTLQEKFSAWMVTKMNGLAKVEYTDKPMTPQQALKHFSGASAVQGINQDQPFK